MSATEPPLILHVLHHLHVGGMENTLVNLINHSPTHLFRHAVLCIDDYSSFRDRIQRADVEVRPELRASVRIVIVGDGSMLESLNDAARSLSLADIAWFASASQRVPQIMQVLDVFVLPSLNEGVSNTILEAMAAGLTVLASRVGGNPELVVDGETGFLFDSGDHAALSARLQNYCDRPDLRSRHAGAARARAEKDFSLQAMVHHYCDLYLALCTPGTPLPAQAT